jgi:hypothetical protein
MAAMVEIDVSVATAAWALKEAGFEPTVQDAPRRWTTDKQQLAVWVRMPGEDAYAVVVVADIMPDAQPGTWREAYQGAVGSAVGYRVGFHERPFRTDPVKRVYCVFVDDMVVTVRDWSRWEETWSVTPVVEPTRSRLMRNRRLAASKLASGSIPVGIDIDPLMLALLDSPQVDAVHAVIEELFLPGLRWRFPRGKAGNKLAARTQVLLYECAPPSHPARKSVWLVVDGPAPRAEQTLTIRLARAAGRGATHRWDSMPEYWRTGPRSIDQLWGIDAGTTAAFVEEVTDMLLAGDVLQSLAMCGVGVDRGTTRLLSGLPDCFQLREWTDKWVANATNLMANAAPWRWRDAVTAGRRPRRIGNLGGFNPNRRPGLFIEYRDEAAFLTFDQSASPLVAPRVTWECDIDYDLVRLGLVTRDQIPMPPS